VTAIHAYHNLNLASVKVNENLTKWFAHMLTLLGGLGTENETLVELLTHIGRKEEYVPVVPYRGGRTV
jgi:hypothetical protein